MAFVLEIMSPTDFFERIAFVLVEPAHPGNIGAAARAIDTMGFADLRVVRPRERGYHAHPEALAYATNSAGVLTRSRDFASLTEALEGVDFAWAVSGYDREFGAPIRDMPSAAQETLSMAASFEGRIAFVFGSERSGLSNADFNVCNGVAAIPANPRRQSLNLAQAVQVAAYELHMTALGARAPRTLLYDWEKRFEGEKIAGPAATQDFFAHVERAMTTLGVIDPAEPKHFMERLARLFNRTQLTVNEINMLRGVLSEIERPKASRIGSKKGA